MYEGILAALDAAVSILWGWCLYRFCGSFLVLKARPGKRRPGMEGSVPAGNRVFFKNGWPIWCFWSAWKWLFGLLMEADYDSLHSLLRTALLYGALFLFLRLFYEGGRGALLFSFATFTAVSEISRFLSHAASLPGNWIYDVGNRMLEENRIANLMAYLGFMKIHACMIQVYMNVVFLILLGGTLYWADRLFRGRRRVFEWAELKLLLLPGCISGMFCVLLRIILVTVEEGIPSTLYDRYPLLTGVVPVLLILCLCSVIYSIKFFCELRDLHEEKNRSVILGKQLESMEERLRETERVYAGVRAMKHDMKNQLAVAAELAGRTDARDGLQAYVAQINRTLGELEFPYSTGSAAVDTLVGIKYHEMRERVPGISFQAEDLLVPPDLEVSSMDLSLILGNGLDNAIEACERLNGTGDCWIRVGTGMRGACFLLKIANSYDGRLKHSAGQEFPETLKEEGSLHGIGLQSIKRVAVKYRGGVDWRAEKGIFILTVMLKSGAAKAGSGISGRASEKNLSREAAERDL